MSNADATTIVRDSFYNYDPNFVLPIVVAVLFGINFVGHFYMAGQGKNWKFMWPFTIACLGETAGYALRRVSAASPSSLSYYIAQQLCIILPPAFMAATHYMVFGRIITYVGEKYSPISARRVTLIFVICDFLSFVVQAGGGSLFASSNPTTLKLAKTIVIIGFIIQIVSFGIFAICAGLYHARALKAGVPRGEWTTCLYTLYIGCILILIRSVYRTVEFGSISESANANGNAAGYLLDHEVFFYVLETLPILIVCYLFLFSHPAKYLPFDRSERLNSSGSRSSTVREENVEMKDIA
jgi:hypothetical protein